MSPPTVFVSYSYEDEGWKDRLVKQLGVLEREGRLEVWDDRRIGGGDDWHPEIVAAMDRASVALLLVSADFLTSAFILGEEVPRLLERRRREGLRVIPVILRPCAWDRVGWLSPIQARPRDGRALSLETEAQAEAALAAIAREVDDMVRRAGPGEAPPGGWRPLPPDRVSLARLPITGPELFGRPRELARLDEAWADPHVGLISVVAWGGVGKSALVNAWLRAMGGESYRGAEAVFGWSFYSQGTREEQVSADLFVDAALRWCGDAEPARGAAWERGERLAELVRRQPTLLVLDGLEPLQHPPGPLAGRLKDQALAALVRELGAHNPAGLCVVTSRLAVADLEGFEGTTARRLDLDHLDPRAGAQVLRAQGAQGEDAELEAAAREFGGHALALTLLGGYLRDACGGDVRRRQEVGPLQAAERHGGHARRIMAAYEAWFKGKPEREILGLLGLFDRPAEGPALAALRRPPAIRGLTATLQGLSDADWQLALTHLRRAGLLAPADPGQPETLDAHPLVREHFGDRLRQGQPRAWREGHRRLYGYCKGAAPEYPDTLEAMAPLYAAVAHGCQAGRHQEALDEVYWPRILRGNAYFGIKKLGAFGADLAALAGFFDPPWERPVGGLRESDRAFVLNTAGFHLQALGRLSEAAELRRAGIEMDIRRQDWRNAANGAGNLSLLHLAGGSVSEAVATARRAVELADRSGDSFQRLGERAVLAHALHAAGQEEEAAGIFREAEALQGEWQTSYPILYSLQGFLYCDLLLDRGEEAEVQRRAARTLAWATEEGELLGINLDHVSLGRAGLLRARRDRAGELDEAAEHMDAAVAGLRQASFADYLLLGLLARAELRLAAGDPPGARADLAEVERLAGRSGMRLHLAEGDHEAARQRLGQARALVEATGYHRRDRELAELEGRL